MKPEDAIHWLNELMPKWDYEANIYGAEPYYGLGHYICTEPEGYVFEKAIEALEKQVPKKPILFGSKHIYLCPNCHRTEYIKRRDALDTYCGFCGQAIDWEEE